MYGYRGAGVLMEVFSQAALDHQAQEEEDAVSSDLRAGYGEARSPARGGRCGGRHGGLMSAACDRLCMATGALVC